MDLWVEAVGTRRWAQQRTVGCLETWAVNGWERFLFCVRNKVGLNNLDVSQKQIYIIHQVADVQ